MKKMRQSARRTSDESVEGREGVRRQVVCQHRLWLRESPDRRDRFSSTVQGAELLTIGTDALVQVEKDDGRAQEGGQRGTTK